MILGPVVGCLGAWFGIKASIDDAQSPEERTLIIRHTKILVSISLTFLALLCLAIRFQTSLWKSDIMAAFMLNGAMGLCYAATLIILGSRFHQARVRLRRQQNSPDHPVAIRYGTVWKTYEYKSRATLLGLPLVHIRTGRAFGEPLIPAKGWIAIGDLSYGVLLSVGGISVGGISIGGAALGLISIGGASLGALAIGGMAVGLWGAIGGSAIGHEAHGGTAVAWYAASGGTAYAHDFAVGGVTRAAHANDAQAREAVETSLFFKTTQFAAQDHRWLQIVWLPVGLCLWQALAARKAVQTLRRQDD